MPWLTCFMPFNVNMSRTLKVARTLHGISRVAHNNRYMKFSRSFPGTHEKCLRPVREQDFCMKSNNLFVGVP